MRTSLNQAIRQILLAGSAAMFTVGAVAAVTPGVQNPPPGPGDVPDYFGVVPNYANSPQPILTTVTITDSGEWVGGQLVKGSGAVAAASTYDYNSIDPGAYTGTIKDVQILNGGSGYSANTKVIINGFRTDSGFSAAKVDPIITAGVITGFTINDAGKGYDTPMPGTGLRKFVDTLPMLGAIGTNAGKNNLGQQLPIATPTTIDEGLDSNGKRIYSDYYVIAEREYTQKLHSDLPPTHLRGYVQLDPNTGVEIGTIQYLGPVIVAQKDRAVRIKLVNQLSTGTAGNLPIPVDHTYMGSDKAGDTENRTAMHLHGGVTPWISDGLPRQWVKPAGETGNNRGESARNVPDMWFDANHKLIASCTGKTTCAVTGASNDPGAGALSFYYTNQQSARMMFYHDHAEGITRLNVYAGLAAGYILQDQTEQDLINGTNVSGNNSAMAQVLPPLADTIPLVIQEKTFIPDNTTPVLNFYGPFKSALNSQDPTWRWGSGVAAAAVNGTVTNGNGDIWVPHVYMPNQNPGDAGGANPLGRWDYGPWFWPPFVGIQNPEVTNPYYDPTCNSTTGVSMNSILGTCEGPTMPGTPNGAVNAYGPNDPLSQPTGTPEAFNDTPLVNGTAYPSYEIKPKKYRLRFLTAGNDRHLNLSLVVASSKNSDTTALGNAGKTSSSATDNTCDGSHLKLSNAAECTEVRMVPWNATQDKDAHFPSWWYTYQKGGTVFDGRPSGVFDPALRGPAMVQIGTEGGFLANPVVIKNQPINYEYNVKNIVVGNVKEHALLLGPAERADVVVDFSKFAGSTVILYNDAPAALPAGDLRLDYFTGDFDNTDTGGAFSTLPGYGPNTRTIMQFKIAENCGSDATCVPAQVEAAAGTVKARDYVDPNFVTTDASGKATGGVLTTAIRSAFKTSQDPIIVPQAAYNATYGTNVSDNSGSQVSTISSNSLTFQPIAQDVNGQGTNSLDSAAITLGLQPKSIIEDWTMDYGRMNAMLGVEMPRTSAINQTAMPMGYADAATELVKISPNSTPITGVLADGTQIWKITHNGVDTHPVHFHLFSVQVINRVGWDGAISPPQDNELGWKEVVRMNPLEDIIVALRPKAMSLPFKLGNSHRKQDPGNASTTMNPAMTFGLDPSAGVLSNVANTSSNFGWEYIWHCHILGHEENDFMRSIAVASQPEQPTLKLASAAVSGTKQNVTLRWVDNSVVSNWVEIQRSADPAFPANATTTITELVTDLANPADLVNGECINQAGCQLTFVDTGAPAGTLYYQVRANNTVGAGSGTLEGGINPATGKWNQTLPAALNNLLPINSAGKNGYAGYSNVTANSAWSVTKSTAQTPKISLSATTLTFPSTYVTQTSAPLTVTLTNTGSDAFNLDVFSISAPFARVTSVTNPCGVSLAAGASCNLSVVFAPTAASRSTGTFTIHDNNYNISTSIGLSGTGLALPKAPTAATSVTIQRSSETAAVLSWTDASNNESSFQVQTSANNGASWVDVGAPIARTGTASTGTRSVLTAAITVDNATNAQYRVNAINAGGTTSSALARLNDTLAPVAATNLRGNGGVNGVDRTVSLTWTDTPNNNASYTVQRCTGTTAVCSVNSAGWATVPPPLAGNVSNYTYTGQNANTTYSFRVVAVNSVGSATSAAIQVTTPR